MANPLDETQQNNVLKEGRDVNVINKQVPVTVGGGSIFFEVLLWLLGILPGLIFIFVKIKAKSYLQKLEQRVQHGASQIDNYLEQRVQILTNAASLVNKSIELDKDVMKSVAALRGGVTTNDSNRSEIASQIEATSQSIFAGLRVQLERYPELKSQDTIVEAMEQNSYLQKEITAAREIYNDAVLKWNSEIFEWPAKKIVAARSHYTTRIPFIASAEVKAQARQNFFL
ncbi:LemA family protein [Mycoplasmopsis primatum]|uniref:LemA family protein n=1 Tax=Mycoplasmopsis primatum TaxID=55604 RepID=UPI000496282F|nr:LemA family protein [Mycoplasmopsis primatum]